MESNREWHLATDADLDACEVDIDALLSRDQPLFAPLASYIARIPTAAEHSFLGGCALRGPRARLGQTRNRALYRVPMGDIPAMYLLVAFTGRVVPTDISHMAVGTALAPLE